MKHNLHNTSVIVTYQSQSDITDFYVMKESNLQKLEKLQNDLNREDTLTESRAMKTKNFVPDVVDVIMAKYPFDSISVKDQTKTLFEELVVGRSLSLQVMKENFQKNPTVFRVLILRCILSLNDIRVIDNELSHWDPSLLN